MFRAEFSDEAATACWRTARRVLRHYGKRDAQGHTAVIFGSLVVTENNGGDVEVRRDQQLVLRVPLGLTPNRPVRWLPGDWVRDLERLACTIPS
jgi:hypothetical protein